MTPFIVAEISKTWIAGLSKTKLTVGQEFERAIEVNRVRGYRLHSFQLHQRHVPELRKAPEQFVETIIAVFEAVASPESADAVDPTLTKSPKESTRV